MARALTSPELTKLRADGHASRLYLAILRPTTIFAAQVNQSFSTHDMVAQVTYNNVTTGAYTDVLVDAECWVGTTPGAYDVGTCRVRKAPTSSVLYVSEESSIDWADDLYLTVVKEFTPRPRVVKFAGDAPYMDYDVAYSDQNTNLNPVAIMGGDKIVWLTGATVNVTGFDSSDSFVLGGSISTKAWSCAEASAVTGSTTNTPTITFNAAKPNGATVKLVLTATTTGKTKTSYRNIWVFNDANPPVTAFELANCQGDIETGGWSFSVRLMDEAAISTVRDRAKVVLFSRDFYGSTEGSVGVDSGSENILAVGWIAGESITQDPVDGSWVEFRVEGPQYWLNKMSGFPAGVQDTTATATKWTEFDGLTVDKGVYHFLEWRTTLNICADWYKSGDTRRATAIEAGAMSLLSQLAEMSDKTILARPVCDHLGRLYVQVAPEYTPVSSRSSIPTVMAITKPDLANPIDFERRVVREAAQVVSSGVAVTVTGDGATRFSLSPGHVPALHGNIVTYDRLLLSNQSQANALCGLISGWLNSEYPSIPLTFAGNYRVFDVAPLQRATVDIQAADNVRGVGYTGQVLPRRITYTFDHRNGYLTVTVEFAKYTTADLSTNGDIPGSTPFPPVEPLPPIDPIDPIVPIDPFDPTLPAYIVVRDLRYGCFMWEQNAGFWKDVTAGVPDDERQMTGVSIALFGGGGGIYAINDLNFYTGDYESGLYKLHDASLLYSNMRAEYDPTWAHVQSHPFAGSAVGFAREDSVFSGLIFSFVGSQQAGMELGGDPVSGNTSPTQQMNASFDGGNGRLWLASTLAGASRKAGFTHSDTGGITWSPIDISGSETHSAGANKFTRGAGYTNFVVMWGFDDLKIYAGLNGDVLTLVNETEGSYVPTSIHQFGANEDGSVIMKADTTVIKISTDGGYNFTNLPKAWHDVAHVINFGGTNWLAVQATVTPGTDTEMVMVSNDDGATWTDITSNLFGLINELTEPGEEPSILQVEICMSTLGAL